MRIPRCRQWVLHIPKMERRLGCFLLRPGLPPCVDSNCSDGREKGHGFVKGSLKVEKPTKPLICAGHESKVWDFLIAGEAHLPALAVWPSVLQSQLRGTHWKRLGTKIRPLVVGMLFALVGFGGVELLAYQTTAPTAKVTAKEVPTMQEVEATYHWYRISPIMTQFCKVTSSGCN